MKNVSGIYEIVNTANGKRYIGSAVNFSYRFTSHRNMLKRGKHHSRYLQSAWNKYGESSFHFRVLLKCPKEHLLFQEQRCIHGFMPEYNISPTAGSSLGVKHTAETRAKNSAARIGKKRSPESLAKFIASMTGKKLPPRRPEHTAKIAAANLGKKASIETRAKMSASRIGKKFGPMPEERRKKLSVINIGRKFGPPSAETRKKIGDAQRGRKLSPEQCAQMSASRMGITPSPETIAKIVAKTTGQKRSPEIRAKLCEAQQRRRLESGPVSQESRAKMSAAAKGRSPGNKGIPMSSEQRAKLREAWKRRKARADYKAPNVKSEFKEFSHAIYQ